MSGTPLLIAAAAGALLGVLFVWRLKRRMSAPVAVPSPAAATIAYQADPAMRLCCEHLRPLEDTARASGHPVWVEGEYWAKLTVGAIEPGAETLSALALPACVTREPPRVVRPHQDTGVVFRCLTCGDGIGFSDESWAHQVPAFGAGGR